MKIRMNSFLNSTTFFLLVMIGIILARFFLFIPVVVVGDSMDPTLTDGERGIAVTLGKPKRFDIVTFPAPDEEGKNYIKRVIGLPGDTIEYRNDVLYVNGKSYDEPYLDEYKAELNDKNPLTWDFSLNSMLGINKIPEGKLFVLGDNRRISKDSRYIGLIDERDIQGDLKFAYWPLNRIGTVH